MSRVIVTGASGFVGQNLVLALQARTNYDIIPVTRETSLATLREIKADHVIHLAGANRPPTEAGFQADNVDYAKQVLSSVLPRSPGATFHYASTIRVTLDDSYGRSKKAGEELVSQIAPQSDWATIIWRLPNLFGKWCKPHYNSFVATFMDQAVRGEGYSINNPASPVELLYIDDLVDMFIDALEPMGTPGLRFVEDFPTSHTTVGEVAELIDTFRSNFDTTSLPGVGTRLGKQLHATFLSFLDQEARVFGPKRMDSDTGSFCELYKAEQFGQVSVLTIAPGASRGNHYHHTKVENFHLAIGEVELNERDIRGGKELIRVVSAGQSFWTRPGWLHTLTNTGNVPAVLVIWANEIFDQDVPDTYKP